MQGVRQVLQDESSAATALRGCASGGEVLMPFKSEKQRRYLHVHEPALAKKWEHEYGSKPKPKPTKAKTKKTKKR
jgi:hypothetical protein